ncbi:MAG: hypothetical protein MRJ96_10155 [Nitrospirales bacterium]|nr:hypothetical protein [Nitrospira sp.]MDR4501800.1 hypothetical protein [Nitrospirales bacterium]
MTNYHTSSTHRFSDCSRRPGHNKRKVKVSFVGLMCLVVSFGCCAGAFAGEADRHSISQRSIIPILGTTYNENWDQVGIVAEVELEFVQRTDHDGLQLEFSTKPGRFSSLAQQSVQHALEFVSQAANLNTDSWTVRFTLPYTGVTLYGESLSAMAAMSVVALAKGEIIHADTVMTGTVTPEGSIGTVGGIPLKILAAHEEHFRRVLIPEEPDVADGDWETPFLMHVSPVKSVDVAYLALTDHPLKSQDVPKRFDVTLAH